MTTVQSHAPGAPCWLDLNTSDLEGAKSFYGQLFGWSFEDSGPEFGHYHMCSKDGAPVAGVMARQSADQPDMWTVYLATPDIESTVRRIPAAGGQVIVPAMKVGTLGSMMVAIDPAGAAVGAWQADDFLGVQRMGEHGTPAWYELLSTGYDRVLPFYRDAFDWDVHTLSDTDEFRYSTDGKDDAAMAGIMDGRGGSEMPAIWWCYIACDDVDATAERLKALGGRELSPLHDTPYGRLGAYADPTGACFCLIARQP